MVDLPEALQQLAMEVGDRPSFSDYLQAQGLMGADGALDDDEDDKDDDEDDEDDEEDEDDVPALTTDAANAADEVHLIVSFLMSYYALHCLFFVCVIRNRLSAPNKSNKKIVFFKKNLCFFIKNSFEFLLFVSFRFNGILRNTNSINNGC